MATLTEVQSLEEVNYQSRVKVYVYVILGFFLFVMAFMNFYPVGDKLKAQLKAHLKGQACNPDYDELRMEWLMPKLVVSDLKIPSGCFQRPGDPIELSYVKISYQLISFSPFGLPFRIDTEVDGQPISFYYVQGFGKQTVRVKDQKIVLSRLKNLLGNSFKFAGSVIVDLSAQLENNNLTALTFKAASKDLQIPSQDLQGFTVPVLRINEFYAEAVSDRAPRVTVNKLMLGDTNSPIRANFRGRIDLQSGAIPFSPIDLVGEVSFSENFRQTLPLIDMMFQSFTQKDGFYQIRLGGTLGAPKPSAP